MNLLRRSFRFGYFPFMFRGIAVLVAVCALPTGAVMAASQIDTFSFTDEVQERRYRALIGILW